MRKSSPPVWLIGIYLIVAAVRPIVFADPTAGEILALDGDKMFDAAKQVESDAQSKFSAADLIRITRKLATAQHEWTKNDDRQFVLPDFFRAACDKAGAEDLDELIQIYTKFEPDSFEKAFTLQQLAALWIKVELDRANSELKKISLSGSSIASEPAQLKDAPPELVTAWQTFKRLMQPIERSFGPDSEKRSISFQGNSRAFYKIVDDILLKHGRGLAERLQEFGWSGPSGTGSELLTEPQSMGRLMALLYERRMTEALAAALSVGTEQPISSGDIDVRIEFLQRCGLDWEGILAGAQIDRELEAPFLANYRNPCLEELAGYGSDHAASLVAMMARRAEPELRTTYAHALSAFISTDNKAAPNFINGVFDRVSKKPISEAVQSEIVAVLQDFAEPNASAELASATLDGFARAKLARTKPTLQALTQHVSPDVAREASETLRTMGENISDPVEGSPVRFRIFANGKMLAAKSQIEWEMKFDPGGGTFSGRTDVKEDGTVGIERKQFEDWQRKISTLTLSSRPYETIEGPSFLVEVPVPAKLDSISRVDIDLFPIQLNIRDVARKDVVKDRKASIQIQRHDAQNPDTPCLYFDCLRRRFDAPVNEPVELVIQDGVYDVTIRAPGAARFDEKITVSNETAPLTVQLSAGSDVHFEVARPDGEAHARFSLIKGGRRMDPEHEFDFEGQTMTIHNLPCGNYVLHFFSSAEVKAQDGEWGYTPARIPYAGRDVPFVVLGNSPVLLDLGEIKLDPVP